IHSKKEEEYAEIITKAKLLSSQPVKFDLLESLGLHDGKYIVLNNHLNRLKQSAKYFDIPIDINNIKRSLIQIAQKHSSGNFKVRLLVNKKGKFTTNINELTSSPKIVTGALATNPIDKDNIFLY